MNHYSVGWRLLSFGLLGWMVFLPLALLVPLKFLTTLRVDAAHGVRGPVG